MNTNQPRVDTSKATDKLTDDELASVPRVKNLFNKFWEEKVHELKRNEQGNKGKQSCFVKSPSDTTIYAPALVKSSQDDRVRINVETNKGTNVNELVSNFVDAVCLEQSQTNQLSDRVIDSPPNLQEKE